MIRDFESNATPPEIEADVCIVGAGAAGIALARALSGSSLSVVVVESGGMTPTSIHQQLNVGEGSRGRSFKGLEDGRARSLGGATKLWYGQCIRFEPIDFEMRDWVQYSGWPITHADLIPYYERAEHFFSISGQTYHSEVYDRFGLAKPEFDPAICETHFTIYSPNVDLGSMHQDELSRSHTVTVVLHSTVTEIVTNDEGTRATGVRIQTLSGRTGTVRARAVVLCGGGIENARLLLISNRRNPAGLGNDHDLVGRFFHDHPNAQTATLHTNKTALVSSLFSLLYAPPLRYFPKMCLSADLQRSEKLLNCNGHFVFEYPEQSGIAAGKVIYRALRRRQRPPNLLRNLRAMLSDLPETLRAAKRFFVDHKSPLGSPKRIRFQCHLEQEPDPDSRVELADTADALGVPQVRLTWKINEGERRTVQALTRAVGDEMARLGLGTLVPDPWLDEPNPKWGDHLRDAFHHAGTTRMGRSPDAGVVDQDCQVFGVTGLYAAGGSVFPTSGYGNPTLTIVALSLRLADHLLEALRQPEADSPAQKDWPS